MLDYQYYPNACGYCLRFGENVKLISCEKCNMISYCCKLHQKMDLLKHSGLCKAIKEAFAGNRLQAFKNVVPASLQNWAAMKYEIRKAVQLKLQRPIQQYEEMMLSYPRTCVVCHKRIGKLINCPNCPFVSFCPEHKNSLVHEKKTCEQMAMYYKLTVFAEVYHPRILNFMKDIKNAYPYVTHSMQDYLAFYKSIRLKHNVSSDILNSVLSKWFTQPLTIFHGLRITKYASKNGRLLIYIIITDITDFRALWAWECILHLLQSVTTIHVMYFHHNIECMRCYIQPVCGECKANNKTVSVLSMPLVYLTSEHSQPDIFAIFDVWTWYLGRVVVENSYTSLIRMLFEQRCPCIFISRYLNCMNFIIKNVKEILEKDVSPIYQGGNPFGSISPILNSVAESIEFKNSYLCIYQDLSLNVGEENM